MFTAEQDYIVISQDALRIYQQSEDSNRQQAERIAIEKVSGYLRSKYDVAKIFAATEQERNPMILLCVIDIVLYHLNAWLPQKMGHEIREERYNEAIDYLADIQKGTIIPDLPLISNNEDGGDIATDSGGILTSGMSPSKYDY